MANIAFGVITNNIDTYYPYCDFLLNAQKHGHKISKLYISYTNKLDEIKVNKMKQFIDIELLKINENSKLKTDLLNLGLSEIEVKRLIESQDLKNYGLVPYGKRRNIILAAALLAEPKIDYLIFFDTDVKPYILINNKGEIRDVDFVGRHISNFKKEDVVITTSDYTGYYIIPSMNFKGLEDLLIGLQKEITYEYVKSSDDNLITEENKDNLKVKRKNKILGGNHAIDLNKVNLLAPYYSTTYHYRQDLILGRGEDLLMGDVISELNKKIIDVDMKIFHDTYKNYPEVPDLKNVDIRRKFYYACLGWIGRNPFLNWYLKNKGEIDSQEFDKNIISLREKLVNGSYSLADEYNSPMFKDLPEAYSVAYSQLDHMIDDYEKLMETWDKFISLLK
ncbi:MAG: hypothetical protein ACQEQH_06065 [Bacillota bacterium]